MSGGCGLTGLAGVSCRLTSPWTARCMVASSARPPTSRSCTRAICRTPRATRPLPSARVCISDGMACPLSAVFSSMIPRPTPTSLAGMYLAVYLLWCFYIRPQPPQSLNRIRNRGPLVFQLMESIKAFCIFIGPALACWIGASRIVDCMCSYG